MIQIKRGKCPEVLKKNVQDKDYYNNEKVIKVLWEMQNKKCCYCEQLIPEKGHGKEVEHFFPKSIFPKLRNEWNNLYLACRICNGNKSNRFPVFRSTGANSWDIVFLKFETDETPAIIDPCGLNPEEYINYDFSGLEYDEDYAQIFPKNKNLLGKTTIDTIKLDSKYLSHKRRNHMKKVRRRYEDLIEAFDLEDSEQIKECKGRFQALIKLASPLAGIARAFAKYKKLDQEPINLCIPRI